MNRTVSVARIHVMNRTNVILMPWVVLTASFVINVIIWSLSPEAAAAGSGGILSIYGFTAAMVAPLVARGFPFLVGFGVTRRDFLGGTVLLIAAIALVNSVILIGLNRLEEATGGFGMGGRFFRVPWFTELPVPQLLVIYALPMIFFAGIGMVYTAIWLRFKLTGMVGLTIALAFAGVGAAALVTWQDGWQAVGDWFGNLEPLTAVSGAGALGALAMAGAWLALRRAPV